MRVDVLFEFLEPLSFFSRPGLPRSHSSSRRALLGVALLILMATVSVAQAQSGTLSVDVKKASGFQPGNITVRVFTKAEPDSAWWAS